MAVDRGTIQDEALEAMAAAAAYRRWLADLCRPWLGSHPIEIGSGTGDHALEWRQAGISPTATEADPDRVAALRARFEHDDVVRVRALRLPDAGTAAHTAAVAINVLEHIEDDVAALRAMAGLVRPGGHVVVLVPAFGFAMSRFDREVGHHRRYTVGSMTDAITATGLELVEVRYVNLVGLIGWFLIVKLARQRPSDGLALRVFERMVPLLRRLEAARRPPFGQSVLAVACTGPSR